MRALLLATAILAVTGLSTLPFASAVLAVRDDTPIHSFVASLDPSIPTSLGDGLRDCGFKTVMDLQATTKLGLKKCFQKIKAEKAHRRLIGKVFNGFKDFGGTKKKDTPEKSDRELTHAEKHKAFLEANEKHEAHRRTSGEGDTIKEEEARKAATAAKEAPKRAEEQRKQQIVEEAKLAEQERKQANGGSKAASNIYEPDATTCPARQQCKADGKWYCCGDSNCKKSRPCASNPDLKGCACEPGIDHRLIQEIHSWVQSIDKEIPGNVAEGLINCGFTSMEALVKSSKAELKKCFSDMKAQTLYRRQIGKGFENLLQTSGANKPASTPHADEDDKPPPPPLAKQDPPPATKQKSVPAAKQEKKAGRWCWAGHRLDERWRA
jgi:hypothetical protein